MGTGWLYTLWPLGPLIELVYEAASLTMPIVTLMLQLDISKLALSPVAEADEKRQDGMIHICKLFIFTKNELYLIKFPKQYNF